MYESTSLFSTPFSVTILQVIVIYFPTAWILYWLVIVVVGIAVFILIYLIRFTPLWTFYYLCYAL